MIDKQLLNSPDLHFSQWCFEQFHINRGVYNTVEQWFYKQGFEDITERRKYITLFFKWSQEASQQQKVKFGQGKLIISLDLFINQLGGVTHDKSNHY